MSQSTKSPVARLVDALKQSSDARVFHVVLMPETELVKIQKALGVTGSTEDGQSETIDADGIWREQVTEAGTVFNIMGMVSATVVN